MPPSVTEGNCTDYFDAGEDMSSHDFSTSGTTSVGAYTCDSGDDATLRLGSCSSGREIASFTMTAGDEIGFVVAWQNDYSNVYIDGEYLGALRGGGSCVSQTFSLPDTTSSTIDVMIEDPTLGCEGDIQIASVCVSGEPSLCMLMCFFLPILLFLLFVFFVAVVISVF